MAKSKYQALPQRLGYTRARLRWIRKCTSNGIDDRLDASTVHAVSFFKKHHRTVVERIVRSDDYTFLQQAIITVWAKYCCKMETYCRVASKGHLTSSYCRHQWLKKPPFQRGHPETIRSATLVLHLSIHFTAIRAHAQQAYLNPTRPVEDDPGRSSE